MPKGKMAEETDPNFIYIDLIPIAQQLSNKKDQVTTFDLTFSNCN